MGAPAIPPPTPHPFATLAQAQAGTNDSALMSPALVVALMQALGPQVVLKAASASLPKQPDGLKPGDPWLDNNVIVFIPAT